MKKIFLISFLILAFINVFSQEGKKKLYFLADTAHLNTPKSNKTLRILWTTPFHYSFIFYADYKAPYYNYLEFSCRIDKKNPKAKIESKKPNHNYVSLKELLAKGRENPRYFSDIYDLYITEALPGDRFQTNKVTLTPQRAPTNDGVILKATQ